jgi:pimeloyl-ACP methyl ester carboxylesterase
MNAELDPTLLAELRELHQSERAPAELERSVLARVLLSHVRGKEPLGARLRAWWNRAPLGWAVLGATLSMAAGLALYLGGPALSVEPSRELRPEPRLEGAGEVHRTVPCPLDDLPPGFAYVPTRMEPEAAAAGLQLDTFAMPIPGCPALLRRALFYVPPSLSAPRGPVLLVLHDGGDSAEGVRVRQAQLSFEALAQREGFIVVYANAAPAASRLPNSGFWQTDPGANRAIDDFAYLPRVIARLEEHVLANSGGDWALKSGAAGPDVYLVGYGSGAHLALEAAARNPERYAGVAALLPDKINAFRPPPRRVDTRLSRILFVTPQDERPWAYWPGVPLDVATIDEWALAVGLPRLAFQQRLQPEPRSGDQAMSQALPALRQAVPGGTRLLDLGEPDQGGPAVRVLVVPSKDAIEVGPDRRPAPVDAATIAWEFLRGAPGKRGAAAP